MQEEVNYDYGNPTLIDSKYVRKSTVGEDSLGSILALQSASPSPHPASKGNK